jgi:DNA helicase IV
VLASVAPAERAPESVRAEGVRPRAVPVAALTEAAQLVADEAEDMGEGGRLAVIAPGARLAELAAALPRAVRGDSADVLDSQVALLTVAQSKGLEFDRVVIVDPAGIIAQSPVGGHDLYVALTRATHRLVVVHEGDLPAVLARLGGS